MASSQVVEIAAASSPFGRVLRDHNRRDGCNRDRDFRKNFKGLVRDHLQVHTPTHTCAPTPPTNTNDGACVNSRPFRDPIVPSARETESSSSSASNPTQRQTRTSHPPSAPPAPAPAELCHDTASSSPPSPPPSSSSLTDSGSQSQTQAGPGVGGGASSLVQMWEARLNRSTSFNKTNNNSNNNIPPSSPQSPSNLSARTTSNASANEEPPVVSLAAPPRNIDVPRSESCDRTVAPEDPSPSFSSSCSSSSHSSDGGERGPEQRIRVADIVRRLIENEHHDGAASDHAEVQRVLMPVVSSPRIRGRQAFTDLLMQLERDRHRELDALAERRAVSKFSHKGRIQSLLKIRFLQRGIAVCDLSHQIRVPSPAGGNSFSHNNTSAVMHLRERFKMAVEHEAGHQNHPADLRSLPQQQVPNIPSPENSSTTNPRCESNHHQEDDNFKCQSTLPLPNAPGSENSCTINVQCESNDQQEDNNFEHQPNLPVQSSAQCESSDQREDNNSEHQSNFPVPSSAQSIRDIHEEVNPTSSAIMVQTTGFESSNSNLEFQQSTNAFISLQEEAIPHVNLTCLDMGLRGSNDHRGVQQPTDAFSSLSAWHEDEIAEESNSYEEQLTGRSYDWLSKISRPRSYWEDRRQEWYREMLEANCLNDERRQLIQRGRVSSFLSSDFRQRMDELMMSHLHRQTQPSGHDKEDDYDLSSQERICQFMSSLLEGREHAGGNQDWEEEGDGLEEEEQDVDTQEEDEGEYIIEEEEDRDYDENEEDMEEEEEDMEGEEEEADDYDEDDGRGSLPGNQYHEAGEGFDQTPSSFQMPSHSLRSWSCNYQEMHEDQEQVASTSSEQPPPSHSYYQEPLQHSSSVDHLSVEMELIIDLRRQMKQLQHEMSELRKSIRSCVDVQVAWQDSIKEEIHSVRGDRARSTDKVLKKGRCCICCEKPVDSLLYRCGHMCACLKCAHELQWSSGKCPICRAPIVDVVRAYTDS